MRSTDPFLFPSLQAIGEFTTEGGIRERMTAARLDQRATQREIIERQEQEIAALKKEIDRLKSQQ